MKKTHGRFVGIVVVLFVVATEIFPDTFRNLVDVISFPWAYSILGKSSLTGHWRGRVNVEGQASREITLVIERITLETSIIEGLSDEAKLDNSSIQGKFSGKAKMPDENGNLTNYEVFGSANRSGSEVRIKFRAIDRKPSSEIQPILQEMYGSWKGTTLELSGQDTLNLFDRVEFKSFAGKEAPHVTAVMTRQ